jgi:hypothetical protein
MNSFYCPFADFKMSITNSLTAIYAGYVAVLSIYGMALSGSKEQETSSLASS